MNQLTYEYDLQTNCFHGYSPTRGRVFTFTKAQAVEASGTVEGYAQFLESLGYARIPSKLSSLTEPNCAEQDEIDAAKCQPAHVSHVEPEREPLDWNKPTPFDPFDGYEVSGGGFENYAGPQHALQRFNDGTDALHGSAFLRG